MTRATRKDLQSIVDVINRQTDNRYGFTLGKQLGGYRLESNNGSRDVSPRLPASQMYFWLHAFASGMDHAVKSGHMATGTVLSH